MNMKKFAVIGVLALVVIGCVLAAGCTSTTTETTTTDSADPVVGVWSADITQEFVSYVEETLPALVEFMNNAGYTFTDYASVYVMKDDGTATAYYVKKDDGTSIEGLSIDYTWKNNGSNNYSLADSVSGIPINFTINPVKGTLVFESPISDNPAFTYYKQASDTSGLAGPILFWPIDNYL